MFVTLRLWLNMVIMLMSLILFHLITHILLILSHHQDENHVIRCVHRGRETVPPVTAAILVIVCVFIN